jgi:hypothetical protein
MTSLTLLEDDFSLTATLLGFGLALVLSLIRVPCLDFMLSPFVDDWEKEQNESSVERTQRNQCTFGEEANKSSSSLKLSVAAASLCFGFDVGPSVAFFFFVFFFASSTPAPFDNSFHYRKIGP